MNSISLGYKLHSIKTAWWDITRFAIIISTYTTLRWVQYYYESAPNVSFMKDECLFDLHVGPMEIYNEEFSITRGPWLICFIVIALEIIIFDLTLQEIQDHDLASHDKYTITKLTICKLVFPFSGGPMLTQDPHLNPLLNKKRTTVRCASAALLYAGALE